MTKPNAAGTSNRAATSSPPEGAKGSAASSCDSNRIDADLARLSGDAYAELIGGVAHDVNNLAMAIRTSVDSLRSTVGESGIASDSPTTERVAEQLNRIDQAAKQSAALMGALASFSRPEIQLFPEELEAVLANCGRFLRRVLSLEVEIGVGVGVEGNGGVDAGITGRPAETPSPLAPVLVDFSLLLRALVLLCGQAVRSGGRAHLSSPRRSELVLELFAAQPESAPVAPSEIDLSQARKLLTHCNAAITLSYADAQGGWSGSIRLPTAPSAPRPSRRKRGAPRTDAIIGRALIAEDHAQVREALIDALTRCGFKVEAVTDGEALVEKARAMPNEYDIMLIDFDLPNRDGASALQMLRDAGNNTPALMISGNIDFLPRIDKLQNTDYLQKPFGLSNIREWATSQISHSATTEDSHDD